MRIAIGGSRYLSSCPELLGFLHAAAASGVSSVAVGCSIGADALALAACQAVGIPVQIYAAWGEGGAGACSVSAVRQVCAAAAAGVPVVWWAGGGANVPLRARLARRSVACINGTGLAVWLAPGSGSLAAAARSVSSSPGRPVWSLCCPCPPTLPGCAGAWEAAVLFGFPAWHWLSFQAGLF